MGGLKLLGIFLLVYAAIVVVLAVMKPKSIWNMKKIQFFIKYLGEQGTVIFFYAWALLAAVIGLWLLIR
ncbi:MAG: hypothetical protein JJE29_08885 [Peptostreptococcaceae bacterium]|nr:hypothetical protein [Peptostreptococcaceae bacterium]